MSAPIFFRLDDLGWQQDRFVRVLELFHKHGQKLNAEAIPLACLENNHQMKFDAYANTLEVHCHGFSHLDHQNAGKKAEFGSQRLNTSVSRDLKRGQEILREIFGHLYKPIFTPPWNRIDASVYPLLVEAGFKAISLDGLQSSPLRSLPALNVSIDVHTRKNHGRWTHDELWSEIDSQSRKKQPIGIMLHHKPMTEDDFGFLDRFLEQLNQKKIKAQFMSELL
jgi:predicted deacetylase